MFFVISALFPPLGGGGETEKGLLDDSGSTGSLMTVV